MTLLPGTRLGPYEIGEPIGAGGMGVVYRARDTRLDRTVAIKVLNADRVVDPQMRLRFDREARAIAALSHPHICHLNDVGHHDGVDFLVMEYLEGETLAARLARARSSGLALDEVLRFGIEIAEALSEAHRRGIVHRDLKPGNVILTKTGVKLLDFGLAKLQQTTRPAGASLSTAAATRDNPLTGEGSVLGTWPYMAPEQLEGKEADARTDIFSFGAVLYEMATGSRAFDGDSHASLIAAILERHPAPLGDRRAAAPPSLERVVRKCLAKDPEARWQSARDLADALRWIADEQRLVSTARIEPSAQSRARATRWPWVAALVAAASLGAIFAWNLQRADPASPAIRRFVLQPPSDAGLTPNAVAFTLSPDGRALVHTGNDGLGNRLYVRAFDQLVSRPIPGTEGGFMPVFSPDGEWVAFLVGGTLKKASRTSGAPPITLANLPGIIDQSMTWFPDNTIVIGKVAAGLYRVPAAGGTPASLTTARPERDEIDHHNPRWLGEGKPLLVTRHRGPEAWDVAVLHPDTGEIRVLVPDAFDAQYLATGHLVFARGETLLAVPFDLRRLEVTGAPVVMLDHVMTSVNNGAARYAVANDGTLAYVPALSRAGRRLAWVGPGPAIEYLPIAPRSFGQPSLSPDGKRVAIQIEEQSRRDVWIYDLGTGTPARVTFDGASEAPIWTRDGTRVTYSATKEARREVYWQPVDGTAPAERLITDRYSVFAGAWSADGQRLVFTHQPPTDDTTIRLFHLERRSITTIADGELPRISPDGRWLAYTSFETGRAEVVVTALDGGGARRQVSSAGGIGSVWSHDGRLLYYRWRDRFFAADVRRLPATIGPSITVAAGLQPVLGGFGHPGYDVAPDGRLLIVQPGDEEAAPLRFEIVLNWFEELKQRVPVEK